MEEVKQSSVHLAIAKRIVDKIADKKHLISQQVALNVLKPFLEDHIIPAKLKKYKIPEYWFEESMMAKQYLLEELASYLQLVYFIETEEFIKDLEERYR
jgi:hypothetical protein